MTRPHCPKETHATMSKRETAELDRQGRGRARKAKASNPKFEIVYEDPARISIWARLKQAVEPAANVVRDVLGGTYVVAARTVLERVEQIEDARAARFSRSAPKAESRTAETRKAEAAIGIEGPAAGKAGAPKTRRARAAVAPEEGAAEESVSRDAPARAPRKPRTAASAEAAAALAKPRRSGRRATRTRT